MWGICWDQRDQRERDRGSTTSEDHAELERLAALQPRRCSNTLTCFNPFRPPNTWADAMTISCSQRHRGSLAEARRGVSCGKPLSSGALSWPRAQGLCPARTLGPRLRPQKRARVAIRPQRQRPCPALLDQKRCTGHSLIRFPDSIPFHKHSSNSSRV